MPPRAALPSAASRGASHLPPSSLPDRRRSVGVSLPKHPPRWGWAGSAGRPVRPYPVPAGHCLAEGPPALGIHDPVLPGVHSSSREAGGRGGARTQQLRLPGAAPAGEARRDPWPRSLSHGASLGSLCGGPPALLSARPPSVGAPAPTWTRQARCDRWRPSPRRERPGARHRDSMPLPGEGRPATGPATFPKAAVCRTRARCGGVSSVSV